MYERRRQAASLVSLLAVTFGFVWACSSGGQNGVNSVTASGGAGSDVGAFSGANAEGGLPFEGGAPGDAGTGPIAIGGTGDVPGGLEPDGTSGTGPSGKSGSGSVNSGGSGSESRGGSENVGGANVGGTVANAGSGSAGAPVVDPTCAPSGEASTEGLFLPCDVAAAFYVCRNCHSNPPVKSVTHSYVTYQDIKPVAPQIYGVVKSGYMPWPPYTMTPYARAVVLKWLGNQGSCAVGVAQPCQ